VAVNRGLFLAPFDQLVDPRTLAELAASAEARGWDGFFLWDHVAYRAPVRAVADPWVALSAVACATERLRLGPLVTLGIGLGSDRSGELEPFGEVVDPRERARLLDLGLERLSAFWDGEFQPIPVQRPRIPVWVAGRWPNRRPLRRAARWDGLFPIELPGPDALATLAGELDGLRSGDGPFDLVVEIPPGADTAPWEAAGATWILTAFGRQPDAAEVRETIEAGPR
jgi:alkanesulfonate monooxygenase SsuD/methylene tetrahydromethanopterin reductase-like flavin-dependent oxidoreductase (luciferase family)